MPAYDVGDLTAATAAEKLDAYFVDHSYITGWAPTQDDADLLDDLGAAGVQTGTHKALARYMRHMSSFSFVERLRLAKGAGRPPSRSKFAPAAPAVAKKADDEFDLFGDDDEDDAEAMKALAEKKRKAQEAKVEKAKEKKEVAAVSSSSGKPAAKSTLVISINPTSPEIDLDALSASVKALKFDGLDWAEGVKKVPVAFGLFKLQVGCTIVDELVATESVVEQIEVIGLGPEEAKRRIALRDSGDDVEDEELEGQVMSAEIISFQKL